MKYILIFSVLFLLAVSAKSQTIFRDAESGLYGVKDKSGNAFISPVYDEISKLDRLNSYKAVRDNTVYFFNQRGEELNKWHFDELGKFDFNAAKIKRGSKYGVINEFGDVTIPVVYDDIIWPMWGYAAVSKNGRWGISDLSGNLTTPIVYDTIIAYPSSVKYAVAKLGGKYGVLDMISGRLTHECELDDFYFAKFNYIRTVKNGNFGLLHYDGNVIASPEYDEIRIEEDSRFADKYIYVRSSGKWGIIDHKGLMVFPVEYDELGTIDKKGIVIAKKDGRDVLLDVRNALIKN